ncbi:Kinesin-like protein KIN-14C [Camellia lanceoleosa]|nr:Kinesin-like protein KIN-14C [Camellia lanceoleosa]
MMGMPEAHEKKGLIPRSLEQIFQTSQLLQAQGWKYKMQASMLEIYNETIRDLLSVNRSSGLDLVNGLIRLMEGENTGPINIGNPGEFTMIELAETVKEVIEILSHVNKRVKHQPEIGLPLSELWKFYMEAHSAPMVKNFCIVYIEMAFERSSVKEKETMAPILVANISKLPPQFGMNIWSVCSWDEHLVTFSCFLQAFVNLCFAHKLEGGGGRGTVALQSPMELGVGGDDSRVFLKSSNDAGGCLQVGVQTSQMEMLPSNAEMFSWDTYNEDISSLDDSLAFSSVDLIVDAKISFSTRNQRYADMGVGFAQLNDAYRIPSRIMEQSLPNNLSPFSQLALQQPRTALTSNG